MIDIHIANTVDNPWLDAPVVTVGMAPPNTPTPDASITVSEDGEPLLRIDAYLGPEEFACFREAIHWRSWIVVGFGHHVHLVNLGGSDTRSFDLGSYFGHLYPLDDFLLAASGENLSSITSDGALTWKSEQLGLDGVIVNDVDNGVVFGQGEWNPPGGWEQFQVSLATGALIGLENSSAIRAL
jgi:hypothetical protein